MATDGGDDATVDRLCAPTYRRYLPGSLQPVGRAIARAFAPGFRSALPDVHHVIEDPIAEGDRVAVRLQLTATHRGAYQGVALSGGRIAITAIDSFRIEDDQIVEHLSVFDQLGLMRQMTERIRSGDHVVAVVTIRRTPRTPSPAQVRIRRMAQRGRRNAWRRDQCRC